MTRENPILIVDDDDDIRTVVELALSDEGYAVVTAPDGGAALEMVSRLTPTLILLDMRMPIVDGWEFARRYRELPGPHAPIVVVTAAHAAAERATDINADGHLSKPFDLHQLYRIVRQHLPRGLG